MTRLAVKRDTHLSRGEIAAEALRQFDQGPSEPSLRSLAAALRVAPAAIYHHYPSRMAIFQGAVELVWNEAGANLLALAPKPLAADPTDLLVDGGIATRRAWLSHHRLARYMAATPAANEFTAAALGLMATLFERLGLEGEQAAAAFHSYCTFMIGAVLFAAARRAADEQLAEEERRGPHGRLATPSPVPAARQSKRQAPATIDEMIDVSSVDPGRDEELFSQGLRRLIEGLTRARERF
ncbi:MAG TPA: TetR/AcrR family transcriptional regulator C-terminal domain-containing protein [Solirubrobacteraceae bacterium]|jgi:AcrR family transcriptional regulator